MDLILTSRESLCETLNFQDSIQLCFPTELKQIKSSAVENAFFLQNQISPAVLNQCFLL